MIDADLDVIRGKLIERAAEIVIALVGEPNRAMSTMKQWRFGTNGSLSVDVAGPKVGLWFDHELREGGDLFKLIERVHGVGFADALKIATDLPSMPVTEPVRHARQVHQDKPADIEAPDTKEFAKDIWRQAGPIEDTAAETS